jgi:hypothetical protein
MKIETQRIVYLFFIENKRSDFNGRKQNFFLQAYDERGSEKIEERRSKEVHMKLSLIPLD